MNDAPDLPKRPLIIAHRGASGERPEHTRAAYELAIRQHADFIEPDLVMSKDGVLVVRHENEISGTTDVAEHAAFASRRTTKTIDGAETTGWFAEDFTLAELKTLRCKERLPELRPQNTEYDGQEPILTFAEVLEIARAGNVGVYPELKHPTFLREQGLDPVPAFIGAVRESGWHERWERMFVQCFEAGPLLTLAQMSSMRWQTVQLIAADRGPWDRADWTPTFMTSSEGLAVIAGYARAIGVEKSLVVPRNADNRMGMSVGLTSRAKIAGLLVHAWTFRAENAFLPAEARADAFGGSSAPAARGHMDLELESFWRVDGIFTDFPEEAFRFYQGQWQPVVY